MKRRIHGFPIVIGLGTVVMILSSPAALRAQTIYVPQGDRDQALKYIQDQKRQIQTKIQNDPSGVYKMFYDNALQKLQVSERQLQATPVGGGAYVTGYSGYAGIPAQELASVGAQIADFNRRDEERKQREIDTNARYYSSERDRIQKEFSTLHNGLKGQLNQLEASERGDSARHRGPSPDELRRQAEARAQYNQQREKLIDSLIGQGIDPTTASSAADNYLSQLVQDSAWDNGIDAAMQDPASFIPGSAFRGYPDPNQVPMGDRPMNLPKGDMPATDPLDQYDPLMNPHWSTDASGHSVQGGTLDEWFEHQKQAQTEAAGTGLKVSDAAKLGEPPPIGDTVKPGNADTVASKVPPDQNSSNPPAPPDADPTAPAPDSDAAKPGYAAAVEEMRQQDAAYSAKVQAEIADPNSRAGQVMQGDWSGVGEDMRSQQQSGSSVQPNAPTTSSAAGGSTSVLDPKAGPLGSSTAPVGKSAPNPVLAANSTQARPGSAAAPGSPAAAAPSAPVTKSTQGQTALPPAVANGGTRGMSLDEALRTEGPLRDAYEPKNGSVSSLPSKGSGVISTSAAQSPVSARTQEVLKDMWLEGQMTYEEYDLARQGKTESNFRIFEKAAFQTVDDLIGFAKGTSGSFVAGPARLTPGNTLTGPVKSGGLVAKIAGNERFGASVGFSASENELSIPITLGPKFNIGGFDVGAGAKLIPSVSAQTYQDNPNYRDGAIQSFNFKVRADATAAATAYGIGGSVAHPITSTVIWNTGALRNFYYWPKRNEVLDDPSFP